MIERGPIMAGRRGLVMGVANDRSIAWGIASALAAEGAELAFTYQGDALGRRVRPLAGLIIVRTSTSGSRIRTERPQAYEARELTRLLHPARYVNCTL